LQTTVSGLLGSRPADRQGWRSAPDKPRRLALALSHQGPGAGLQMALNMRQHGGSSNGEGHPVSPRQRPARSACGIAASCIQAIWRAPRRNHLLSSAHSSLGCHHPDVAGFEVDSFHRRGFSVFPHDIPLGHAGYARWLDVVAALCCADFAYLLCFSLQAEREEILAAKKA
jgi:hypothetical protein